MECPARETQQSVDVAVLHQNLEDFASRVHEKNIVWNDDCRATARLQGRYDVLNEVELLIACRDHEVVAVRCLVGTPRAKRRIRKDDVEAFSARRLINRVTEADVGLDLVEVEVHER